MNSLAYAILGVVSRTPVSGYDLGKRLELLWAANLSQIYPILSKLEEKELVRYELIEQIGKPNKKKYYVTEKGTQKLRTWIQEIPAEPIIRDEFIIKFYSIWLTDSEVAIQLLNNRKKIYLKKQQHFSEEVKKMEEDPTIDPTDKTLNHFSRYLLLTRRIRIFQFELDWCDDVLRLINQHN
ncbi:PadR family transcriptional regulator [Psychrobacillus soli]|uniref:PadR family transcriptional regulator n=1 Tax=Psychrobacillus soli TaxID=1543965 RepID=A0A544SWW6_9BACI|nr:PadR family transcriptional regulator [Psychrobacillus soli]TQR09647.1 PadR family transcriptional regulator [Psychrobacillus soli]